MLGGRRPISGDVPSQIRARALASSLGRRSVGARPSKASPSQVRVRVRVKVRVRVRARARVRVRVKVRPNPNPNPDPNQLAPERAAASLIYCLTLLGTLLCVFVLKVQLLSLVCVIAQFAALTWYTALLHGSG